MALRLAIENVANLPDGGPISIAVPGKRGIDIGRDAHLDWTLPDPDRFISGKHCEIRYDAGAYVLTDVSSNGTFLNDSPNRMPGPHRLRTGDRLLIGQYIIAVSVEADEAGAPSRGLSATDLYGHLGNRGAAPAPIDPRELKPVPSRPKAPDFLDWAMDVFDPLSGAPLEARRSLRAEDASWLPPPVAEPEPAPAPPVPNPRRPIWTDETQEGAVAPAPPSPPRRRDACWRPPRRVLRPRRLSRPLHLRSQQRLSRRRRRADASNDQAGARFRAALRRSSRSAG